MSSENKFGRLGGTRLAEQKPFRGFDITSLIRKDEEQSRASNVNRPESKSANVGQRSRRLHQSSPALAQVFGKILTRFPFSRRRREEPDVGGGIRVALLVAEHQRGSSTVPPDQPVHQLVQLEPLPTVPWTAAGQWRGTADTS